MKHTCSIIDFQKYKEHPKDPEKYIVSKTVIDKGEPEKRELSDIINDILVQSNYLCGYLATKETDKKTFAMAANLSQLVKEYKGKVNA